MTREQLAETLDHLDPGAALRVEADVLARMFDADANSHELLEVVEAFASEHRCAFTRHEHGRAVLCFEKNDIY
jgi:hypothetical protein